MLNHIEYVKDLQMVARRNRAEGELPCSRAKSCCPIEFIILCSSLRVILSIDRQGRYLHAPIGLKAFNRVPVSPTSADKEADWAGQEECEVCWTEF